MTTTSGQELNTVEAAWVLTQTEVHKDTDRGTNTDIDIVTHIHRPRYIQTQTEVHIDTDRGTCRHRQRYI